jgi:hypothetical protein
MKHLFGELKKHINDSGDVVGTTKEIQAAIAAAEHLGEMLLGCTFSTRGEKFIIRMLEIYYGGIGDDGHDWYRTRYTYKKSKYVDQTKTQSLDGFRVYLSSLDVQDNYTRMDIVAGNEGVPISFLLRSVWDSSFNLIGSKNGSPNIVLNAMGITAQDHGKCISVNENSDLHIENTRDQIIKEHNLQKIRKRRINLKSEFEKMHNVSWNLSLE